MSCNPDRAKIAASAADGLGRAAGLLRPLFSPRQRSVYMFLILAWAACVLFFWQWWLRPEHNIGTLRYAVVTSGMVWMFFLQFYFLSMFIRARRPGGDPPEPGSCRVAMVVTKAPSEPFDVVRKTLEAMLAQDYPHDTWLADEDPDAQTEAWCAEHGVQISTRRGREDYHRPTWPRRTRCKEGNLAYFYDHYGYDGYDFVSQLDADHVPKPTYLSEMLKPFADPSVGYASAPSICSSNAGSSWAARSRLYEESLFHGALQTGYSGGWAPMCIGSHYAVRTSALQQIGGLGPDLAEDHSTSMIMNANGWRGVHAVDAIAHGAGPANFADMIIQEFQWSRSLMTILLQHTPRYIAGLPLRLKFQFVFCQLWYGLFSLFMAMMFLLPISALCFGVRFADVTYPAFLGHVIPSAVAMTWLAYRARNDGLLRPYDAKVISWERAFVIFAKWPWVLYGCAMAVLDSITGRFVDFRITPKGDGSQSLLPLRVLSPYFVLAVASLVPVIAFSDIDEARGFYLLAIFNAVAYSALLALIVIKHKQENGIRWNTDPLRLGLQTSMVATVIALSGISISLRGVDGLDALSKGAEPLVLTKTQFTVSGAGMGGGSRGTKTRLTLEWEVGR